MVCSQRSLRHQSVQCTKARLLEQRQWLISSPYPLTLHSRPIKRRQISEVLSKRDHSYQHAGSVIDYLDKYCCCLNEYVLLYFQKFSVQPLRKSIVWVSLRTENGFALCTVLSLCQKYIISPALRNSRIHDRLHYMLGTCQTASLHFVLSQWL